MDQWQKVHSVGHWQSLARRPTISNEQINYRSNEIKKYTYKKRKIKKRTKEKEGGGEGRSERSTGDTILWPPRFFALSTNAFQAVRFQDPPIMKLKINPIYLLLPLPLSLPLSPPICSHLPLLLTWFVSWKIDRGSIAK